jgi:hypothetical protein
VTEVETDEAHSTTTSWWRSPRAWAQLAIFVALVAVIGYLLIGFLRESDDKGSSAAPTTTPITSEAEVESAYRRYLAMVDRVYLAPNPADPEIAQLTTGDVRDNLEQSFADLQAKGSVYRVGPEDRQTVLSTAIDGKTATLSVCYVGQSGEYDAATGAELQPMQIFTTLDAVTVLREQGAWKVSHVGNKQGDAWQGVHDCAA